MSSTFKKYDCRDINFTSSKNVNRDINSFHKMHDSPWIKNFGNQKKIKRLIKLFLEKEPELRASEYFAKPKKKGLPAPTHQDNFYWKVKNNKGLTMWIALCLPIIKIVYYYNGSHKKVCYLISIFSKRNISNDKKS